MDGYDQPCLCTVHGVIRDSDDIADPKFSVFSKLALPTACGTERLLPFRLTASGR